MGSVPGWSPLSTAICSWKIPLCLRLAISEVGAHPAAHEMWAPALGAHALLRGVATLTFAGLPCVTLCGMEWPLGRLEQSRLTLSGRPDGRGWDFPRGCCLEFRTRRPGHMETPRPVPANTWGQCGCLPCFCKHVLWGQTSERRLGCRCWAPWQVRGGEGVGAPA